MALAEPAKLLALSTTVSPERPNTVQVIVGAAIVADGRVLACARTRPPELAGLWEFPGGKVEPGESERDAVVRECREELDVEVEVAEQVGPSAPLADGRAVLRVYRATLRADAVPRSSEHGELRWLDAERLDSVPWLPADAPIVAALRPLLREAADDRAREGGGQPGRRRPEPRPAP